MNQKLVRLISLSTILVFFQFFSVAQNNTGPKPLYAPDKLNDCVDCKDAVVLIYDFKCKQFFYKQSGKDTIRITNRKRLKIKNNEEFKVKVVNVNRYMYNIGFTADNIAFGSEPPALFKQLFLGDGSYMNTLIDNANKEEFMVSDAGETNASKFKTSIEDFIQEYNKLSGIQLKANQYCPSPMPCCDDETGKIEYEALSKKLLKMKLNYYAFIKELADNIVKIEQDKKEYDECAEAKKKLEVNQKSAGAADKLRIQKEIDKLNCVAQDFTTMIENSKSIKSDIEKLWAFVLTISEQDLMKASLFNNNLNRDHFSYVSPPIFPKGNKLTVGLNISPSDSSLIKKWNIMPLYNDSLSIDIFVKRKWFVSFSSGPFMGIGKALQTETYGWQAQPNANGVVTDSSQYKLVATGRSNSPVGIAAFANIGVKFSEGFGIGISPGVGLAIEKNPKTVYFLGGSLFFGERQQFNITAGVSLMQVDQIRSDLYPNIGTTLYNNKPEDVEYIKKLNTGGFISISYSIFSSDKTKNVSSSSKSK